MDCSLVNPILRDQTLVVVAVLRARHHQLAQVHMVNSEVHFLGYTVQEEVDLNHTVYLRGHATATLPVHQKLSSKRGRTSTMQTALLM